MEGEGEIGIAGSLVAFLQRNPMMAPATALYNKGDAPKAREDCIQESQTEERR